MPNFFCKLMRMGRNMNRLNRRQSRNGSQIIKARIEQRNVKLLVLVVACLIGSDVFAEATNPYQFGKVGTTCSSQGEWTDRAANALTAVVQIAEGLKDEGSCTGIKGFVKNLSVTRELMSSQGKMPSRNTPNDNAEALSTIRIGANDKAIRTESSKLLLETNISAAANASEVVDYGIGQVPSNGYRTVMGHIPQATGAATAAALDSINNIFTSYPKVSDCLYQTPGLASQVVLSSIQIAASLAGRHDAQPKQLALTLENFTAFLRDRRIRDTVRKARKAEFVSSVSCLLESLSTNYCAAVDVQKLLSENLGSAKAQIARNEKGELKIDLNSPLAGYFMLVQPVPIIAKWLQKIQFGALPKTRHDALFKNEKLTAVTTAQTEANDLFGSFSIDASLMSDLKTLRERQDHLMKILDSIVMNVMQNKSAENFLILGKPARFLYWDLLGLQIPQEAIKNTPPMEFSAWVFSGDGKYKERIGFDEPNETIPKIQERLEKMIHESNFRAGAFFRKFLIPDKANLVVEALADVNLSVYESLTAIQKYLAHLEKRVLNFNASVRYADTAIIGDLQLASGAIAKVLQSFEPIRELVKMDVSTLDPTSLREHHKKLSEAYSSVIDTAFDEFGVLLQRDSYFPVKMGTFVKIDYGLSLRSKTDFSPYIQDLLLASGLELENILTSTHNSNPEQLRSDLSGALEKYLLSLHTVEGLFADSLVPYIQELKFLSENKRPTRAMMNQATRQRLAHDVWSGIAMKENPVLSWAGWIFGLGRGGIAVTRSLLRPDLYPQDIFNLSRDIPQAREDEFGTFKRLLAQTCIQTLAFQAERQDIERLCKGTVLESWAAIEAKRSGKFDEFMGYLREKGSKAYRDPSQLGDAQANFPLNVFYDNYAHHKTKNGGAAGSTEICALRDHYRRNLIYWLSFGHGNQN